MNRALGTWPYLLFTLVLWSGWEVAIRVLDLNTDGIAWTDTLSLSLFWCPALVFLAGLVLGFRRGYDPVVVIACFGLWIVLWLGESLVFNHGVRSDDLPFGLLYYGATAHLGIAAGLLVHRLTRKVS